VRILFISRHLNSSGYETLRRLIEDKFDICGVLLAKDRPAWTSPWKRRVALSAYLAECRYYCCRPLKVTDSEFLLAKAAGLNILEVDSLKSQNAIELLNQLAPDIIVIGGGWHELIPPGVFTIPRLGCVNAHPSLLPDFRGTSITRWQVLAGVETSGCTIHYVNETFDAGAILAQERVNVRSDITPQELFADLSALAAPMMTKLLHRIEGEGKLLGRAIPNDARKARYYPRWRWDDANLRIDWSRPLREIDCFIRANTQESYRYLGPWCETSDGPCFVRQSTNRRATGVSGSCIPEVVDISNGILWLEKAGDPDSLGIKQVQAKTGRFRFNRGRAPSSSLKIRV
jgi:methionyl-tRNA formyltransferase